MPTDDWWQGKHGELSTWTIYDHPHDFPDAYVARRFRIVAGGSEPTTDVIASRDLGALRTWFERHGLTPFARSEGDDPVILETWL